MKKDKVLIIKTGYSEVLDKEMSSTEVSYGDVLRVTPLLHLYKENHVTWFTDKKAIPLLKDNPYIHRILPVNDFTILQLQSEEFDKVINLEKISGICALSDKIKARRNRHGFTFNSQTGEAEAWHGAHEVISVGSDMKLKKENKKTSQELLFEMVGGKWQGEEYILGYQPKTREEYDVGLNTKVGGKWPSKAWSAENWSRLEEILTSRGYRVTRQDKQGPDVLEDLNGYMDWINSCKAVISTDSLGLHVAIALRKKVLGLFGSTPSVEVYMYGRGEAVLPEPVPDCLPCFMEKCDKGRNCIDDIKPELVAEKLRVLRWEEESFKEKIN